jgi:hypothetical protein
MPEDSDLETQIRIQTWLHPLSRGTTQARNPIRVSISGQTSFPVHNTVWRLFNLTPLSNILIIATIQAQEQAKEEIDVVRQ